MCCARGQEESGQQRRAPPLPVAPPEFSHQHSATDTDLRNNSKYKRSDRTDQVALGYVQDNSLGGVRELRHSAAYDRMEGRCVINDDRLLATTVKGATQ